MTLNCRYKNSKDDLLRDYEGLGHTWWSLGAISDSVLKSDSWWCLRTILWWTTVLYIQVSALQFLYYLSYLKMVNFMFGGFWSWSNTIITWEKVLSIIPKHLEVFRVKMHMVSSDHQKGKTLVSTGGQEPNLKLSHPSAEGHFCTWHLSWNAYFPKPLSRKTPLLAKCSGLNAPCCLPFTSHFSICAS